jgi:hypothetical protein
MYKTQKLDATGQAPISRDRRRPFMDAKSPRAVETLNVRTGESWILERFTVECSGGQAAGALLVVDEATRRPIAIEVDVAIGAQHLVDTPEPLACRPRKPRRICVDNYAQGADAAAAFSRWLVRHGIEQSRVSLGSPWSKSPSEEWAHEFCREVELSCREETIDQLRQRARSWLADVNSAQGS